jgi:hypothetical protein
LYHFSHIEAPGFDPLFHNTSFGAAKSIALLKHMNWILSIMLALPESVAEKMGEEVSSNIRLKRVRSYPLSSKELANVILEAGAH